MATLTSNYLLGLTDSFISDIKNSNNSYYCFVGKATPWTNANGAIDEGAILSDDNSIGQVEQLVYQNINYGKLITNTDIMQMTKRYNWANGTTYTSYDNNNANLYSENFYVITDTNDVFKCIYNGFSSNNASGIPSTHKPSITSTSGVFQTPDGYIWKYMYTCDSNAYTKFQTNSYIPVSPNTSVINSAKPGTIDNMVLVNNGNNYQVFEEGFLQSYVNNYVVQLPSTSAPFDNYYTDSTIYLKTGFGAGQLRTISSYSGLDKTLSVIPPFNLYENIKLDNIYGQFVIGDLVTQKTTSLIYYYNTGYFNNNDTFIQSDTAATGSLRHGNTTTIVLESSSNNFILSYPVFNTSYSPVLKSGTVNITNNSIYVNSVSGTAFVTDYSSNNFIRVGINANTNIRRVTAVNSSVITVDTPFNTTLLSTNNYNIPSAFSVDSITLHHAEGSIIYTNLNSAEVFYSNVQPSNQSLLLGETVVLVDSSNTSQGANGTVSYYDSTSNTLILSNVQGSITANLYLYGLSSQSKVHIDTNISYPNITVETIIGGFQSGIGIDVTYANSAPAGNATVVSTYSSPGELTEYIISPSVNIEGDGNGALAYCTVDLSSNNPNRSISTIVLVDNGQNYTKANVSITSNTLFGSGANVRIQISPVAGHGADPYTELGATYCGISKIFDTGINEGYILPLHGSYRTVGIIKNPSIKDVILNVNNFTASTLNIRNTAGTFDIGEIVLQSNTNAAGVIKQANSTYLLIDPTIGSFISNTSNDNIRGLLSNTTANCVSINLNSFSISSNNEQIIDNESGGYGILTQIISNTQIRLTDVVGRFSMNDYITENNTKVSANIVSIFTSNGNIDSTSNFGTKFNQTARITMSSNSADYSLYEYVTQDITFATGRIISTNDELDLIYTTSTPFAVGDIVVNANTNANAVITSVNTIAKYMKLSAVTPLGTDLSRSFKVGDTINNLSNTKISVINNIYNVLLLDDVNSIASTNTTPFIGTFQVSGNYNITGNSSGAVGIASDIKLPELVRESGKVLYLENMAKFDKTSTSKEQVNLIIKI